MKIALIGQSGAGKTTIAKILCRKFAVPHLKTGAVCRNIAQVLLGSDSKENTQKLDDALTQIDPAIFMKATLRQHPEWVNGCVLDSLRFEEDYDEAIANGFKTVRIICDQSSRRERLSARGESFTEATDRHRSELELATVSVDLTIDNHSGVDHLERIVQSIDW